jgi:DNA-binding transcriptional LysR family regulator
MPGAHRFDAAGRARALAMEMHQIRYFLAVCETLNFTRAAERCNVTQPALTRAVQKLEEEVGGLLFRRERNLTHLTDLGRLMRPHLADVLSGAEAAKRAAKGFLKLDDAPLNLGVMCTIGPQRFMGFLAEFRAAHPGIELTLLESVPPKLSELLMEGKLDVAIMAQPGPFEERFDVRPLYRERFVIAFPAGHRFEQRNALAVVDVDGESYLSRINCEYRDLLGELCRERGAAVHRVYRSEREDWIQTMVAAGLGICFMPEYSASHPGVCSRPVVDPPVEREVSLVTVAGRRFSPSVSAFVAAVRRYEWGRLEVE